MTYQIEIKNLDFINIEDIYFGGTSSLISENEELKDFKSLDPSGFFALNDILIYELRKYKDSLGTYPKDKLSLDEYIKLLRNHIMSKAYRFIGFINVDSMSRYIKKFSKERRIDIESYFLRDFASKQIFLNFLKEALSNDHPVILQRKRLNNSNLCKYSLVIGIHENKLLIVTDGKKKLISFNEAFDLTDVEMGLLYINIKNKFSEGKMDYKEKYEDWLNSQYIDEVTKKDLKKLTNEEEIKDSFYRDLEFGTAGLRGKLGPGSNRMNKYTVGKATQGLAEVIKDYGQEAMDRGIAIAYDVRNFSKEFSKIVSGILAENGIKVYLFEDIRPTPMLSFAVRELKTQSGIVITASHNPKDYNGYKVYWEEGSQILDEHADKILTKLNNLDFKDIKWGDYKAYVDNNRIEIIGKELDEKYYQEVLNMKINDDINKSINIVYSPLNGTGYIPVTTILDRRGFDNVHLVEEQRLPDGDFKTVGYPNPEDPKAFKYALDLAKKLDSDLIIATDPDCDRVAMMAKNKDGDYYTFNGNQIGVLLINYILQELNKKNQLPENGAIVKSIVTGEMAKPICKKYGVDLFSTLTGFKNICALPNQWDKTNDYQFIFGYEESIGYTYGDYVRDKDAVVSSMMIAEMAAFYNKEGKTLVDVLYDLYEEHGYYKEKLISLTLEGLDGQERIKRMMDHVRSNPFTIIGEELKVEKVIDYLVGDIKFVGKSNVLKYELEDGSWYSIRPSGTEPKIKLYMYTKDSSEEKSLEKLQLIEDSVLGTLNSIQ